MEKEEDMETTISMLTDLMVQLNLQRFRKVIEMKDLLIEVLFLKRRFVEQQITTVEFDTKIRDMERELKEPERRGIVAQQEFDRCKDDVEHCRRQLQIVKDVAESVAKLNTELQRDFLEIPDTVEELEGTIQDYTTQANVVLFLNHNVLEEYER